MNFAEIDRSHLCKIQVWKGVKKKTQLKFEIFNNR